MSYGTVSRFALVARRARFISLANGSEAAVTFEDGPFGDFNAAFYIRWSWDTNFQGIGANVIVSSELSAVLQIISTGNMWDNKNAAGQTWRDLYEGGAQYTSPYDHKVYASGAYSITAQMDDWLKNATVHDCELATDVQWRGWFQTMMQDQMNSIYGSVIDPGAPVPPTPSDADRFPPTSKTIQSAGGLIEAQCTRTYLTAAGNVPQLHFHPVV